MKYAALIALMCCGCANRTPDTPGIAHLRASARAHHLKWDIHHSDIFCEWHLNVHSPNNSPLGEDNRWIAVSKEAEESPDRIAELMAERIDAGLPETPDIHYSGAYCPAVDARRWQGD